MIVTRQLVLVALIGIAIGTMGATKLHAPQVRSRAGYVIAEVEVKDTVAVKPYSAKLRETLTPYDGHVIIAGGKTTSLEGEPPKTYVMIAFESVERAQAWYDSPAYTAIKPIRQRATNSRLFIAEGVTPK
jgi:uncharacterized protein (DUF1330 family)